MKTGRMRTGQQGEELAQRYLESHHYRILETNYRSGRWGELDIIAIHDADLVFVEVKTRMGTGFGSPIEAVTYGKVQRLRRAAQQYKLTHPHTPDSLRFDVVCLDRDNQSNEYRFELYRNIDA